MVALMKKLKLMALNVFVGNAYRDAPASHLIKKWMNHAKRIFFEVNLRLGVQSFSFRCFATYYLARVGWIRHQPPSTFNQKMVYDAQRYTLRELNNTTFLGE